MGTVRGQDLAHMFFPAAVRPGACGDAQQAPPALHHCQMVHSGACAAQHAAAQLAASVAEAARARPYTSVPFSARGKEQAAAGEADDGGAQQSSARASACLGAHIPGARRRHLKTDETVQRRGRGRGRGAAQSGARSTNKFKKNKKKNRLGPGGT